MQNFLCTTRSISLEKGIVQGDTQSGWASLRKITPVLCNYFSPQEQEADPESRTTRTVSHFWFKGWPDFGEYLPLFVYRMTAIGSICLSSLQKKQLRSPSRSSQSVFWILQVLYSMAGLDKVMQLPWYIWQSDWGQIHVHPCSTSLSFMEASGSLIATSHRFALSIQLNSLCCLQ